MSVKIIALIICVILTILFGMLQYFLKTKKSSINSKNKWLTAEKKVTSFGKFFSYYYLFCISGFFLIAAIGIIFSLI